MSEKVRISGITNQPMRRSPSKKVAKSGTKKAAPKKPAGRRVYAMRYTFEPDDDVDIAMVDVVVQALKQWAALAALGDEDSEERLREVALDVVRVRGARFQHSLHPGGRPPESELVKLSDRQITRRKTKPET